MPRLVSAESVTEGHPDKIADRIADTVLDAYLTADPRSRVACEVLVTTGLVMLAGEIGSHANLEVSEYVRDAIREIGYTDPAMGFDADGCAVISALHRQSGDIARGVERSQELRRGSRDHYDSLGAGDQGIMFGYATTETHELMPLPITLASRIVRRLAEVRKSRLLAYLRPDGKAQVTLAYDGEEPVAVTTVVLSAQHAKDVSSETLEGDLRDHVLKPALGEHWVSDDIEVLINPSGGFVTGGPHGDTGLTGRKIVADTYGAGYAHGGGAFSGKDPTKVDRSATYFARYIAKNVVAAGLARRCLVELAYAIGRAHPVGLRVETYGAVRDEGKLTALVKERFDARPAAIIERLGLAGPIYTATSAYGHFGRPEFPWEDTSAARTLI